jgi:hypothetical protein
MQKRFLTSFVLLGTVTFLVAAGCGGDDETGAKGTAGSAGSAGSAVSGGNAGNGTGGTTGGSSGGSVGGTMGSPEPTGSTCQMPSDCYANLDTTQLSGPAECIAKVDDGYCTHECETDDDCCALEGECRTGFKQVCASFENTDKKYCFLSCEDADLVPAAGGASSGGASAVDANEYCEREANPRFACRSTGGGIENRLVCLPDAGAGGAPNNQGGAGGAEAGGANAGGADMGGAGMGGAADPTTGGVSNAGAGGAP